MPNHANEECRAVQVARAFFQAATKLSDDNEDILPQEDGVDQKLSVFHLFSELFPEYANDKDRDGNSAGKNGLMRLQFNKIGYEIYDKEQSRRVPAVRAKPGNPGYGFRRARWRDTISNGEDRRMCETVLRGLGVSQERLDRIRQRIADFREEWDNVRRPSRPAGPGRPRGHKRSNPSDPVELPGNGNVEVSTPVSSISSVSLPSQLARKPKKTCKSKPGMGGAYLPGMSAAPSTQNSSMSWQSPMPSESSTGNPVAAIVLEEEEWEQEEEVQATTGKLMDEEESQRHVHHLMEENASLRSLNMSLIYEREKLLRELRQSDSEMAGMQKTVDGLLQTSAMKLEGAEAALSAGFRWLSNKLIRKARGLPCEGQEIPAHLRQILEQCFDKYDEYLRQNAMKDGFEDDLYYMSSDRKEQSGFYELHMSKHGSPSEDLREELARSLGPSSRPEEAKRRELVDGGSIIKKEKGIADSHDEPEHVWSSLGEGDVDVCDGDMDVGNYDYLFSHCPATTAF
ncbi:hypothetical protein GUITHDRAFT_156009 [Guillardia theta CCMP2712]|uniref:Uncharacterized protein n=1 Tax=Guillardia theta (strain CCMP2712) TaxID=905079 RepID=L1IBR8_GUITC|nr:hypothetical protein GUITHDRAFT_156009 [Guillardia theta CCMP2712]EKX33537.1 hypothetical protein GUITHDRAFT_156009 [Guillardia theta CCMP2712]|mmetsp:Transcript_26260/g.86320  ORF Transcript_26260/g.86320 Transcript_26260/m.86320 type:complete len:513 (-) Transcript_26260:516-2054(-)|eukprot:XP_005820517.1 hypothetical protein GUITHDRAFT_156009 [Guillardia theta CCMP2712]